MWSNTYLYIKYAKIYICISLTARTTHIAYSNYSIYSLPLFPLYLNSSLLPYEFPSLKLMQFKHVSPPILLSKFSLTITNEVTILINSSRKTYSPLNPFPSSLIPAPLPTLLPFLVSFFKSSPYSSIISTGFKTCAVYPLKKKPLS